MLFHPFLCAVVLGVGAVASAVKSSEKQQICTTPNSFLQLLYLFKDLLVTHREAMAANINKLSKGLKKLRETVRDCDFYRLRLVLCVIPPL